MFRGEHKGQPLRVEEYIIDSICARGVTPYHSFASRVQRYQHGRVPLCLWHLLRRCWGLHIGSKVRTDGTGSSLWPVLLDGGSRSRAAAAGAAAGTEANDDNRSFVYGYPAV